MQKLLQEIKKCAECEAHLPLGPRPVVTASPHSKIVIIGQAPGTFVHKSGIAWDDKSGENLRGWMQIDTETFYDTNKIAIIPMGFCYPGRGKSGDLPPRKECATLWHQRLFDKMDQVELLMLVGKYAQNKYLGAQAKKTLTETVKNYNHYLPRFFVLPHPSPRNNIWQAKNPWFKTDVLPAFRKTISAYL